LHSIDRRCLAYYIRLGYAAAWPKEAADPRSSDG
jgi:hypothetical protein